ncbi:hypothetical protein NDK47_01000 [Brevibacillus ruminantium]|uniref:Uncharacterized protein n=1 Tax=Brevibacillus ruminantium TaxID=2950604 RepID=A0ABY4WFP7_9BACL|nr:hypothetical protein [Brevibacillus ruminantium]USG65967.1 hypothetical protein NDK47_01000 [Brevibacillus ruminantium]
MKKSSFLTSLVLVMSIGFSGLMTQSVSANSAVEVQKAQSQIEHVKVIGIGLNSPWASVTEEWYDPVTGFQRNDKEYIDRETINSETKVYKYEPNESLFKKSMTQYQDEIVWKLVGYDNLGGIQVKKVKSIVEPKGGIYQIAYIDISTGLPIKEETYGSNNEHLKSFIYFFDHVNDPSGEIFKEVEKNTGVSIKK